MRISDWSSDVCSSDLNCAEPHDFADTGSDRFGRGLGAGPILLEDRNHEVANDAAGFGVGEDIFHPLADLDADFAAARASIAGRLEQDDAVIGAFAPNAPVPAEPRSEEHTSELQSLMRISYAVFCLKKKNTIITHTPHEY